MKNIYNSENDEPVKYDNIKIVNKSLNYDKIFM